MSPRPYRLAAVTSHPVQYQSPLFQRLAADPRIDLTVFYGDDRSLAGDVDPEFGVRVTWDRPIAQGYRAHFLKRRAAMPYPWGGLAADARIISHLRQGRFDAVLIHSYATRLSALAYIGAFLSRTPVLLRTESERIRPRSAWVELLKEALLRPLLAATSAVLVIGRANRSFYDHFGVPASKQFFTPYAVDNAYFESQRDALAPSRQQLRRAHGWTDDVVVVGFSGKLIPLKHVGDLIDAVALLQRDGLRVGLLVVGDGPLRSALEQRTAEQRLKGVTFAGFRNQTELAPLYVCMDLLVLPSERETWGLVLNEAMLFGLPVLASNMVGAAQDLVEEGRNGFTFDAGDVAALAARIRRLVENADTRRQFGDHSRSLVQRYSHDTCTEGIVAALERVSA